MRPYFKHDSKIATSSYVEAEFAELKTRAFRNQLPMRIDKFNFRHIEYLDEKLKLTSGESNQKLIVSENISSPVKRQYKDEVDEVDEVNLEMEKNIKMEKEERDSLNEIEN